jgi:hypothetical protein
MRTHHPDIFAIHHGTLQKVNQGVIGFPRPCAPTQNHIAPMAVCLQKVGYLPRHSKGYLHQL